MSGKKGVVYASEKSFKYGMKNNSGIRVNSQRLSEIRGFFVLKNGFSSFFTKFFLVKTPRFAVAIITEIPTSSQSHVPCMYTAPNFKWSTN